MNTLSPPSSPTARPESEGFISQTKKFAQSIAIGAISGIALGSFTLWMSTIDEPVVIAQGIKNIAHFARNREIREIGKIIPPSIIKKIVITVPVLEEICFRGLFQDCFLKNVHSETKEMETEHRIGLSTALFAAAHVVSGESPTTDPISLIAHIVSGAVFGSLYEFHGLTSSITAHICSNFIIQLIVNSAVLNER